MLDGEVAMTDVSTLTTHTEFEMFIFVEGVVSAAP